MYIRDALDRLQGVRKQGGGFVARCPAHDDRNPSLSITEGRDGRAVLHCFAGCSYEAIAGSLGLNPTHSGSLIKKMETGSRRVVATYDYTDETGALLYQKLRYEPKRFVQRRPDGAGGFAWGLGDVRRVLYRLPELLECDPQVTVFLVEGEKDADRLSALGLVATTNAEGAANGNSQTVSRDAAGKWRPEYTESLRARHVCILPDNDEPGLRHAAVVARALHGTAESARILRLPGLLPKGDVSDWLDAGGTIEELHRLIAETAEWMPKADDQDTDNAPLLGLSFADFMRADFGSGEAIAFHLQRGELGQLVAVTNRGKSTLLRNALLHMATGTSDFIAPVVPGGTPRRVMLLDFETSQARLQSDLARMTRDYTAQEKAMLDDNLNIICDAVVDADDPLSLSQHMDALERAARLFKPDLIVVDTVTAAFDLRNENDNSEVTRYALKPLRRLARRLNCAVLFAHHIGKAGSEAGGASVEKAYLARGASAFGCYPVSGFLLTADAADTTRVTLTCAKRKDGREYAHVLHLDEVERWFRLTSEMPPKIVTNDDLVIEALQASESDEMRTAELEAALVGKVKPRTMMNCLNRLAAQDRIRQTRRGRWALTISVNTTPHEQPTL